MSNNKAKYKNEIFSGKVKALTDKIAIAFDGEEVNICMSSLMCMLTLVSQEVLPENRSRMVACLEDCIKSLGKPHGTDTVH